MVHSPAAVTPTPSAEKGLNQAQQRQEIKLLSTPQVSEAALDSTLQQAGANNHSQRQHESATQWGNRAGSLLLQYANTQMPTVASAPQGEARVTVAKDFGADVTGGIISRNAPGTRGLSQAQASRMAREAAEQGVETAGVTSGISREQINIAKRVAGDHADAYAQTIAGQAESTTTEDNRGKIEKSPMAKRQANGLGNELAQNEGVAEAEKAGQKLGLKDSTAMSREELAALAAERGIKLSTAQGIDAKTEVAQANETKLSAGERYRKALEQGTGVSQATENKVNQKVDLATAQAEKAEQTLARAEKNSLASKNIQATPQAEPSNRSLLEGVLARIQPMEETLDINEGMERLYAQRETIEPEVDLDSQADPETHPSLEARIKQDQLDSDRDPEARTETKVLRGSLYKDLMAKSEGLDSSPKLANALEDGLQEKREEGFRINKPFGSAKVLSA